MDKLAPLWIYISGHSQAQALVVAAALKERGYHITSTWINDPGFGTQRTEQEKIAISHREVSEVLCSDVLVSLAAPDKVPGGKHVELGVAIGTNTPCFHLGPPEHIFHFHPNVQLVNTQEELLKALAAHDALWRSK